jgi:hypothetical protein
MEEGEEKERKKKRIKKNHQQEGGFPWGQTHLAGCAMGRS